MDIFSAVERKHLGAVKRILNNDPAAARATDCWGRTALMLACVEGNAALAGLLLPWSEAKASERDGETALMLASFGHPACVELLLPASDPLACDADGWTALMWAASSGSERCVELLLPHSDAQATNDSGLTALDIARTCDQQAREQQIRRHLRELQAAEAAGLPLAPLSASTAPDPAPRPDRPRS